MSHFAELDANNTVLRVVVGNPELDDADGLVEIAQLLGGKWIQTSYNAKIRGNYAGIGYSYVEDVDLFMPPKCHDEAVLNTSSAHWACINGDHVEHTYTD